MDIEQFIKLRPELYHLTDRNNLPSILEWGRLLSTKSIIDESGNPDYIYLNNKRRADHAKVIIGDKSVSIRDQRPISEINLIKCLTDDWTIEQFYNHLNSRVFMWCKVEHLANHYGTYKDENPVILRFDTRKIFEANVHVKFCRLNSGATRSSSHHKGGPPPRGKATFLTASDFKLTPSNVKEVTFEDYCILTGNIYLANEPYGKFKLIS